MGSLIVPLIHRKRSIPLSFLARYLQDCCCKTPFVYSILYQMCHRLILEMEEALKWQERNGGRPIPDHLRGRVSLCPKCVPEFRKRAQVTEAIGVFPLKEVAPLGNIKPTHLAFRDSWDHECDDWVMDTSEFQGSESDNQL